MKQAFVLPFLFYFLTTGFNSNCQEKVKIKILKSLFPKFQIDNYKNDKFVSTIARNKYAAIPLSDSRSKVIKLNNGLHALAFNIFLADKKSDYENMLKTELYNFMDISKDDSLWHLTENERLIQIIIFDISKNRFIAKADNFPIEKLMWLPTGMGDLTQYESIAKLEKIQANHDAFYMRMDECPDCQSSYYFFNPEHNKLKASKKFVGCFEDIRVENNRIIASKITNCYDATYNDEEPIVEKIVLLKSVN